MSLTRQGDNTYANYAEANRAFWRQTVLPLVNRTARAMSGWLSPAFGGELRLAPDIDAVEALSPEREALWARVGGADFLTNDEKRAAVGYGREREGGDRASRPFARKYREDQARDDQGRWVDEGGEVGGDSQSENDDPTGKPPNEEEDSGGRDPNIIQVAGKGGIPKAVYEWTVRQFVSQYCKGSINEVLPGQFEGTSIKDLLDLAKGGDAAAKTCVKLLSRGRFRK